MFDRGRDGIEGKRTLRGESTIERLETQQRGEKEKNLFPLSTGLQGVNYMLDLTRRDEIGLKRTEQFSNDYSVARKGGSMDFIENTDSVP